MNNPRLAGRYAKSIVGLAVEQNELESVYADMKFIRSVCSTNPDFVSILKSPIFTSDKKEKLIEAVTVGRVSRLTDLFIKLLIRKTRENALPEIAEAFIGQYNEIKGIHRVKLTTAAPASDEVKQVIIEKVRKNTGITQIEMETSVDEDMIGGFKLEIGDVLIDASIERDLNDIRKQFLSNDYILKIR
jgi:F-type H+-transporting ATPase subunit delta